MVPVSEEILDNHNSVSSILIIPKVGYSPLRRFITVFCVLPRGGPCTQYVNQEVKTGPTNSLNGAEIKSVNGAEQTVRLFTTEETIDHNSSTVETIDGGFQISDVECEPRRKVDSRHDFTLKTTSNKLDDSVRLYTTFVYLDRNSPSSEVSNSPVRRQVLDETNERKHAQQNQIDQTRHVSVLFIEQFHILGTYNKKLFSVNMGRNSRDSKQYLPTKTTKNEFGTKNRAATLPLQYVNLLENKNLTESFTAFRVRRSQSLVQTQKEMVERHGTTSNHPALETLLQNPHLTHSFNTFRTRRRRFESPDTSGSKPDTIPVATVNGRPNNQSLLKAQKLFSVRRSQSDCVSHRCVIGDA